MAALEPSLLRLSLELLAVFEGDRFVQANHRWERVLGWTEEDLLGRSFTELVHPEDRAATESLSRPATGFVNRYRHKDGSYRWLLWESTALPDGRWLCAARDITREREMLAERERLAAAHCALRNVATVVASGASSQRVFSSVSEEAGRLLGADAAAVVMLLPERRIRIMGAWSVSGAGPVAPGMVLELAGAGDLAPTVGGRAPPVPSPVAAATGALTRSLGYGSAVTSPVRVQGEEWGLLIVAREQEDGLPPDAAGRLAEFAELTAMAVANADARRELEQRALTDSLTAFMNNRAFHDRLAAEFERARRHERALSLAVLDVDDFKAINDTRGHRVGDQVLGDLAGVLRDNRRTGDLVGRIGGDELALILTDCTAGDARSMVDRLRPHVAGIRAAGDAGVTFSAGICDVRHADSPEALFRLADEALYRSKAGGKARTTVHGEDG